MQTIYRESGQRGNTRSTRLDNLTDRTHTGKMTITIKQETDKDQPQENIGNTQTQTD